MKLVGIQSPMPFRGHGGWKGSAGALDALSELRNTEPPLYSKESVSVENHKDHIKPEAFASNPMLLNPKR